MTPVRPPLTSVLATAMGRALRQAVALTLLLATLMLGAASTTWAAAGTGPEFDVAVVEHLRVKVPADARQAWLAAEQQSWEPWLQQQPGFLGRELLWDSEREEGTLLIRWASRAQWKAISESEVAAVQRRFEQLAKAATGSDSNPFPLVFEGELLPP